MITNSNLDNSSQIQNSSNSYQNVLVMISLNSNDKLEEKSIKLNKSILGVMFSNYGVSSNLSNDMYFKSDNFNIIYINKFLISIFEECFKYNIFDDDISYNLIYKEIQIIEKIKSKVNNIIEIEHKFDKNIKDYFCKPISKEFISKLNIYNKEEMNKLLNYKDKIFWIYIENDKIKFNIILEDYNNNHCIFPIGLYEKGSNKLIHKNIFIFLITITDRIILYKLLKKKIL